MTGYFVAIAKRFMRGVAHSVLVVSGFNANVTIKTKLL